MKNQTSFKNKEGFIREKKCLVCSGVFTKKARGTHKAFAAQKFCSVACTGKSLRGNNHALGYRHKPKALAKIGKSSSGKNHWNWQGGMPKCEICDKILSAKKSKRCNQHQFIDKKGKNSHKWIKDRSKLKKSERKDKCSAYMSWRKEVYKRDYYKCRIADENCRGRLEAHHILRWSEYPELRYSVNNGITLCHAHHPRKRAEEKRLSPYFMELVSVSNETF